MGKTKPYSGKRSKLSTGKQNNKNRASIDRLSALPDAVICHILSFLPTELSVATSVLSRRWRFLWAYVPNIELKEDDEYMFDDEDNVNRNKLLNGQKFLSVVDRVTSLYKVQSMDTFRLYMNRCEDNPIKKFVKFAIARNVKNPCLTIYEYPSLPPCIFTCKTLVELTLEFCDIREMDDVCLPALKKLHLEMVQYNEIDDFLHHLVSGCPVLEELYINRTSMDDDPHVVVSSISSPTIKALTLTSEENNHVYRLKIDTPAVKYLRLDDYISEVVSGSLTSLVEADLTFNFDDDLGEDNILYSGSVIKFLARIYNVKDLKLSSDCMKVPDSTFAALNIKFHNLTKLELSTDWRFLSTLIENADNLEVLIINEVGEDLKCWIDPLVVPKCLSSHLKSVSIYNLGCTEHEFDMVRYLLKNAEVLEKMEIYSKHHFDRTDIKESFVALKRIASFQRGSKACELLFH